jgi:hypothetical protein
MLGAGSQDGLDVVLTCAVRFSTESPLPSIFHPPMQTCRQAALNILLSHPPLNELATALLSPNDGPHTPRSRALPTKLFSSTPNRKSSDSWNSSIHEDDFATEWKPEHLLRLQRVRDFALTPGLSRLARLTGLFISRSNRLWTRCRPIYSHHSTG